MAIRRLANNMMKITLIKFCAQRYLYCFFLLMTHINRIYDLDQFFIIIQYYTLFFKSKSVN